MDPSSVLALLQDRPPTLGAGRLLCIDGPSGSGKTTLAAAVSALAPASRVVHMDELYDGWAGLPGVGTQLSTLLNPLASGEPGTYRRYDWHLGSFTETVTVESGPLLVVEGVGSWAPELAGLVTALVWVEAELDVRKARGLARDGEAFAPYWDAWARAEDEHFARCSTREHADLVSG
ncbi:4-amino-4-deoxy-L-arabinose transferase [Nocardioides sp. CN2-186]|uniref:4-amino-4-deoxy-L-arabinose transferase n=1 Tax=Nocardioides tweenelious TaxID=3156607 RepID=UPI0032B360FC